MKAKKSPQADLERKRPLFFQIGIAIALCLTLFAFEWATTTKPVEIPKGEVITIDEMAPIKATKQEKKKVEKKKNSTILKIIENGLDIDDPYDFTVEDGFNNPDIPAFKIEEEKPIEELKIFIWPEQFPSFDGGEEARIKYLSENLVYPELAKSTGIQGKVFVAFIVEPDGSISNVKLLRGIGGGCDEETIRAVQNMPKWNPGIQGKKKVRVQLQMPVNWKLSK